MTRDNGAPLLAIGIDAGDAKLIRRMIEQDEMPVLKSLLGAGKWIRVESPTGIGSAAVWPCFVTGEEFGAHGVYSEWWWEPATMSLSRFTGRQMNPFWKSLAEANQKLGILAVPFMPLVGLSEGFEVSEWGPNLWLDGGKQFGPAAIGDLITKQTARTVLSHGHVNVSGPDDYENLQQLVLDSLEGVKLRGEFAESLLKETKPDLSIIVFTEAHESAHCLWQTVEPEHELYKDDDFATLQALRPTLKDIYQELDRQIGKLVEAVGVDATVLVFSLHGMKPARGVPVFLGPLMCELGFSKLADWKSLSWTERAIGLIRGVKRRTPNSLKQLYYKALPPAAVVKWARPTMMPQYDWSKTRAFALVSEHHGSIRINLIGREAKGIVPLEDYEETCRQVEQQLRNLTTDDGKPLVKTIIRPAKSTEQALKQRIPDLIVHWEAVGFRSPLRIKGSAVEFHSDGRRYLSQHSPEGFCIVKSDRDLEVDDVVQVHDMGRFISRILRPHLSDKLSDKL
jgi:predicted AlkP superfamily phosphohydrolase/phosphomutase